FPASPNQSTSFTWDGKDGYGRTLQGEQSCLVRVGYVYDAFYERVERFGYLGKGIPITGDRARQQVTLWQDWQGSIGTWDARTQNLGSWTLNVHHYYHSALKVLHLGNGEKLSAEALGPIMKTVAGCGSPGCGDLGDGSPGTRAQLSSPIGVAIAP